MKERNGRDADPRAARPAESAGVRGDDPAAWAARLAAALVERDDPAAALQAVCEAVRTLLPCDRVQIWRGDVRQMSIRTVASAGFPESDALRLEAMSVPMRELARLDQGFLAEKLAVVRTPADFGEDGPTMFAPFAIDSAIFLPLERGTRLIGALQLSWCGGPPRVPEAPIAELIRHHVSLGLDFVARTDDALRLSQTLTLTATLLARIHDPDELLQSMAARITEAVGCDWAAVFFVEREGESLQRVALHGFAEPPPLVDFAPDRMQWFRDRIASAEDGVVEIADVDSVPEFATYFEQADISSYVAVPLLDDDVLVGLLALGYRRFKGRFARRQISLAKGLAQHALVALRNARLVRSLQEANQVKADFIAAVSHDLRTPLHVLIGYNAMLLDGAAGALAAEQRELVARMYDCAVHFLDLIDGVLGVGRVDSGLDRVVASAVSLPGLCADLVREVEFLRRPEVAVRCDVAPVIVSTDAAKLTTILRNLVTNALKFTSEGFVEIHGRIEGDDRLVLRVSDTGPGIAPAERPKIFEMFRQGSAGLRAGGSGLGLGLYLVKRLSHMLGGDVELLAREGETVFEVRIPLPEPARPLP
jgi:signal transduction histidine kinase